MNEHNAPKRLWLSTGDADGEHQVWFDQDEGGTMYVRADLMLTPAVLADALSAERFQNTPVACMAVGFRSVAERLKESVND